MNRKRAKRVTNEQRLRKVMETLRQVSMIVDLDVLLQTILRAARKTMECEASSLMLLDHATNELYFHQVAGGAEREVKEIRLKVGQGIGGRVAETGRAMIVNDVSKSRHFFADADRRTGFKTKAILAIPLQVRKTIIGVLEAINKRSGKGFDEHDLLLFTTFGNQAAVAIENARLYSLAAYDGLTRIFTRRYFDAWFESEFARLRRYKRPMTLMMADIDRFKLVNDQWGHAAGDYVITSVAQVLKQCLRTSDVLARYGGEEFVLALTETPLEAAPIAAERIRKAVEAHSFKHKDQALSITVSLGLTGFRDEPDLSAARLLQEADQALYEAKQKRNSYFIFKPTSRAA